MKERKSILIGFFAAILLVAAVGGHYCLDPWGFYWKVPQEEAALRLLVVETAQCHLGKNEADNSHREIIDLYNAHLPLAMGYQVQYEDSWCATFVSAVAIQQRLTDIIPTECSCERQIELFRSLGRWEEKDWIIPLPGDLIYYDWENKGSGNNIGWSDHVGIVVGTKWPFIKVIEGNKDDSVCCRIIRINDSSIRGFGKPDYASAVK